jgi:hypothetical protein
MTHRAALIGLAILVAGCGSHMSGAKIPRVENPAASPTGPAPKAHNGYPPPAFIAGTHDSAWLAFGSFCWTGQPDASGDSVGMCADFAGPGMRTDIPRFHVEPGQRVRIVLGFRPAEVSLSIGGRAIPVHPSRTLTFRVERLGDLELFARPPGGGDASYVARLAR